MHRSAAGSVEKPQRVTASEQSRPPRDTIAAVSTATGEGAIALVRLSGHDAITVADRIYRGPAKPSEFPSHMQRLGEIVEAGRAIDQVMMSVHRAPASYTGEDLVEISCHGGIRVTASVLEACLHSGARTARPGEFTERAFLNGKMDLTQAEAVIDLIRAQTDLALRSAHEQLEGRLGQIVNVIRAELIELLAHLEAAIDFSEEGIAPDEGDRLCLRLDSIRSKISELLTTEEQGRILREGVRAVLYGPTNAGKSSLLNRLLGYDRAIVSEMPGTTRDTIEELINLRGIPLRLSDTAGVREPSNDLEREGINRTQKSLVTADLILHVLDRNAAKPADFDDPGETSNRLLLLNKSDLPEHPDWKQQKALRISCKEDDGLDGLVEAIVARVSHQHWQTENPIAINARHRDCLRRALEHADQARATMNDHFAPEYVALDLRSALRAIGEVTGAESVEPILDSVFAQFCIGK